MAPSLKRSGFGWLLVLAAQLASGPVPLAAAPADAPDSPRHQEWAEIQTKSGRTVRALVVFPEVNRPVPAVVLVHENRGLTDWERRLADQLAAAGYVAIAPDLLSQTGPNRGGSDSFPATAAARDAIYALKPDQVQDDLDAVVEYARGLSAVDKKVCVAGFCWGGGQVFRYAAHNPRIAAAFVFYGAAPDAAQMAEIRVPVYGFYGEDDFRITGEVSKVSAKMTELKKSFQPVVYLSAGHGFMRAGEAKDAKPGDQKARADAWARLLELLGKL